jgi:hypothetical protein
MYVISVPFILLQHGMQADQRMCHISLVPALASHGSFRLKTIFIRTRDSVYNKYYIIISYKSKRRNNPYLQNECGSVCDNRKTCFAESRDLTNPGQHKEPNNFRMIFKACMIGNSCI